MANTTHDCPFCDIVRGAAPATVVRESERVLAFRDLHPQGPNHVLVIPKEHHPDLASLRASDTGLAGELILEAHQVAWDEHIAETGYRLVCNTGQDGGQTVSHLHWHVLGGRRFSWPPG